MRSAAKLGQRGAGQVKIGAMRIRMKQSCQFHRAKPDECRSPTADAGRKVVLKRDNIQYNE